jgi:hypothetical protein
MLPELEALLRLQHHDVMLIEARHKLEEIPKRRTTLETAVAQAKTVRDQSKKDLEHVRLGRRALEKEAEAFQAEVAKLERQLFDVKTNQEYQAMLHQIGGLKQKRSDAETKILESYEREDGATKLLAEAEKRVAAEEARLRSETAALEKEAAALTQSIHSITQDREAEKPAIPGPLLARYDRVAKQRDGVGVAEVRKDACGACFRTLPPQALQEAKRSDAVMACESCGRILVWTESSAS